MLRMFTPESRDSVIVRCEWYTPTAAAAKKANCAYIITRNKRDFANSPVPALTPGELLTL